MYLYILETYTLSVVGAILYWSLIKDQTPLFFQKCALIAIVALSFALPPVIDHYNNSTNNTSCTHQETIQEIIYLDYCPAQEQLPICYELALKQERFCQCSVIAKENILLFHPHPALDQFLVIAPYTLQYIAPILFCLLLSLLFLKIAFLSYLIITSKKRTIYIEQQKIIILYPKQNWTLGSFQLWNKYIVWQTNLQDLSQKEQDAIIWHELSHLLQRDTALKIILQFVQTTWLLNPCYYFFAKEFDRISEHIADKFAVAKINDLKLYVSLLIKVKQQRQLCMTSTFKNKQFGQRILFLLADHLKQKNKQRNPPIAALLLALLLAVSSFYSTSFIEQQADKIKAYQTLAKDSHDDGGRTLFCKRCLLEKINHSTK